jgi:hypothetical protein
MYWYRMKSALVWIAVALVMLLWFLLRAALDYHQGRAISILLALVLGSLLFWWRGRRTR